MNDGDAEDWRAWHALAMGLVNLSQILLADRFDQTGEAPIDVLKSCADRFPRS